MKKYKFIVVVAMIALTGVSCSEDELLIDNKIEPIEEKIVNDNLTDNLVTEEQAIEVANAFWDAQTGEHIGLRSNVATQSKASVEVIKDQNNEPLMYILNYPEGGWAIVSATKRYYPILAYSDKNAFELTSDMGTVELWLAETKDAIKTSETMNDSIKAEIRSLWNIYTTNNDSIQVVPQLRSVNLKASAAMSKRVAELGSIYGYGSSYKITSLSSYDAQNFFKDRSSWTSLCNYANSLGSPPEYTIIVGRRVSSTQLVGPLLATQWHQNTPFNDLVPGGDPVGCAAIALSQVMKFYQYPQLFSYNGFVFDWNDVPTEIVDHSPGQAALAKFVGDVANTTYWSSGSWTLPGALEDAIRHFGYDVTRADHNQTNVKYQLLGQRPVIMGGGTVNLPKPLNYLGNGHYWVCDGVHDIVYDVFIFMEFINMNDYTFYNTLIYTPANPIKYEDTRSVYFHINWGWNGKKDGWFYDFQIDDEYPHGKEDFYIRKP